MATVQAPKTEEQAGALLKVLCAAGSLTEVQFRLDRVLLADGEYHTLTRPVTVRVLWDDQVEYWVAIDNKHLAAGAGDAPEDALREYLAEWTEKLAWLTKHEATLGKGLLRDLAALRRLLNVHAA